MPQIIFENGCLLLDMEQSVENGMLDSGVREHSLNGNV